MSSEEAFRAIYVTSGEIVSRVDISSAALSVALKAGKFPQPLDLGEKINIWLRADVEGHIIGWAESLRLRRNK